MIAAEYSVTWVHPQHVLMWKASESDESKGDSICIPFKNAAIVGCSVKMQFLWLTQRQYQVFLGKTKKNMGHTGGIL